MFKALIAALALVAASSAAIADDVSKSAPGAAVTILEPADGATVSSPVTVKFGLTGMDIAPSGSDKPNSGHHHLLIDTTLADPKSAIPADDNNKHFGKGQTEAVVELKPGTHTLQLVLGDKNHIPHDPVVQSKVVTITVK